MTLFRLLRSLPSLGRRLKPVYRPDIRRNVATSGQRVASGVKEDFQVGSEASGFVVREVQDVPELQLTAYRLEHSSTGSDYLHISRNDTNNVFCVGFRTTPMDSTGVPHILEHIVLCGSERYPCRDPFFKMLNRSLSTFMNAMTGSDYTIYPFSTQHPEDFRNLISVYMDAVFRPNLSEMDFLQEGWRLEHQDVNDVASPLALKGVVFNEMKGVFADSQSLFAQRLQNGLLPSHTYGVVSGGDPLCIPNLTWSQLRDFHARHYHPSNARFFTYGHLPLSEHLEFVNDNYLRDYQKIDPQTQVPREPSWSEPKHAHVNCGLDPIGDSDAQASLAVAFKLVDVRDTFETFVLQVLGELMMNGPNSPFYKALLETKLGSGFSPSCGFDSHTRDTSFAIGLQGIRLADLEKIKETIDETFGRMAREGFPDERVEAVLHNYELGIKHQTSNFGLGLAMALTPLWNLGGDPIAALRINETIARFRKCMEKPHFLREKIEEHFVRNTHKYTLTMTPKEDYEAQLLRQEEELLTARVSALKKGDKERIKEQGLRLASKQEQKEDLSVLPTLEVSDISRTISPVPTTDVTLSGVPLQVCHQPTNGITYFCALLDTQDLPDHLRSLVPLFCRVLTRMGAGRLDFRQLDQEIDLFTGGLNASTHLSPHPIDSTLYEQGILLSSHCLDHNLTKMLHLWSLVFNEVKLNDPDRFGTVLGIMATEQANTLVHSGHRYAISGASATTSHLASLTERWGGLSLVRQMNALNQSGHLAQTLEQLAELSRLLLSRRRMRMAVNHLPQRHDATLSAIEVFLESLNGRPEGTSSLAAVPADFTPRACKTHQVFPLPVNFASKAYPGVPYAHPDAGATRVLSRLLFPFLHREIREKGGAYGGGATNVPGGPFAFYSYRDPNSTRTFESFDRSIEWVISGGFGQLEVNEAKLGVFQEVDKPVAPGFKGRLRFLSRITDELLADHRRLILDVEPQDLVRVARTYLRDSALEGACLIGPANEAISQNCFWNTVSD